MTYPLQNQLRNAISLLHLEIHIRVIKQKNLDLSPVVCIDDARASINEVLRGEAGAGGDSAVYATTIS